MEQFDKHQLEKTDQQLFTDSFNFCCELLKKKEYYLGERETNIFSRMSLNYGHDMYDAMMIIMDKIKKSNEHKVAVEKSKIGYDDNYNQLNQQQQQQKQVGQVNIDINNNQDKMISKKRKIPVDEIHFKKRFKADNKKNNCNDSSNVKNIQITSLNGEDSVTIKDGILSDNSIDVDEINNSKDHSIGLGIKLNGISNLLKDNNKSCSNKVIDNVDHQKNTRIRTRSLSPKKYDFCTKEDDKLSSTTDKNDLDVDDNDDDNSLNPNQNLKDEIKVFNEISFEEKTRIVKLAIENPTWSSDLLREHSGCMNIRDDRQVERWKKHIEQGGSFREKMNFLNNWVMNKCIENKKKGEIITYEKIQKWGLEAKKIFKPVHFSAGFRWLANFKKNHEITGQPDNLKINCNLQKKEPCTLSTIVVPYEIKAKVVNLANENPHWGLEMLREKSGCNNLKNINQLHYWKQLVRNFNKKKATGSKVPKKLNSTSV